MDRLTRQEANALVHLHGVYPADRKGHAATPIIIVGVDARRREVELLDADGKYSWRSLDVKKHREQLEEACSEMKRSKMKRSKMAELLVAIDARRAARVAKRRAPTPPSAPSAPSGADMAAAAAAGKRTVQDMVRDREKKRKRRSKEAACVRFQNEMPAARRRCSHNLRQTTRPASLYTHLAAGWSRARQSEFLSAEKLQAALAAAATRRSETDSYTHGQLFDAPVKGLGGRTRFAALCALCAELDLGDMYEFGVMESDPSVTCVRKLLEWRLGALPHKKRSSKSRGGKKRKKRRANSLAKGKAAGKAAGLAGAGGPDQRPEPEGFTWRDSRLLARAMTGACKAYLERDPEFAGGAKRGKTYALVLPTDDMPDGSSVLEAMVICLDTGNAQVQMADMAPISSKSEAAANYTHEFTGRVRTLDYHEFALAKARAAAGVAPPASSAADGAGAARSEAQRQDLPIRLAEGVPTIGAADVSEEWHGFLVRDNLGKFFRDNLERLSAFVDKFERFGSRFGKGKKSARESTTFASRCGQVGWTKTGKRATLAESRSRGAIIGYTGASCGTNLIEKPAFLWEARTSEYTNYPIPYAHAEQQSATEIQELLSNEMYMKLLENLQSMAVELYGEGLVNFLLEIVPEDFRLGGLIWNQAAMTGGTRRGFCKKHVDQFNFLNGLYHFSAKDDVKGGKTVFFRRDDPKIQQFAALFKIGRGIIGPFSKVAHGSTEFEGGRAILGAYVDRRIVKFCLAYEWKDKTWVPRTKERYEELKSVYDAFVREHQL